MEMTRSDNDPRGNPALAARNRRMAIVLGLVAVLMYVGFIAGYAL